MTALQMDYEFEIGYELANLSSRGYTKKEKSTLLTQAQNAIVLDVIARDDSELKDILTKNLKDNYEANTHAFAELKDSMQVDVPNRMLKLLQERVDLTLNTSSYLYNINTDHLLTDVSVFSITEDYYNANIENPDKQPYHKLVWRLLLPSIIVLIGNDTYTISKYRCIYLKRPSPIIIEDSTYTDSDLDIDEESFSDYQTRSLDCDLDESFHRKIVDKAIILAIEPTGNAQRLQTKVSIT